MLKGESVSNAEPRECAAATRQAASVVVVRHSNVMEYLDRVASPINLDHFKVENAKERQRLSFRSPNALRSDVELLNVPAVEPIMCRFFFGCTDPVHARK